MLTIGLFPNMQKPAVRTVLGWMVQYLQERSIPVLLPDSVAQELNCVSLGRDSRRLQTEITLAISLGGDGTLLNAARQMAPAGIPLCGVNLGRVGFLTEIELPELTDALEHILSAQYAVEERLMLEAVVLRGGQELYAASALNDIVISKGGFSRMIHLNLFVNGKYAVRYSADGLIFATPLGSTAYSLSAGGPILHPQLNAITVTPICPHTLHTRSLLLPATETILVRLQAACQEVMLMADGQMAYELQSDDEVLVRQSPVRARFICFKEKMYYEKLRTKLRWSELDADI